MSRRQRFAYAIRERSRREIRRSQETYCCLHIWFVIGLSLFFGLYFGIIAPEVRLTTFIEASCSVTSATTRPNYDCWRSCSYCSSAYGAPNCGSLISHYESLDPNKCTTDSSQCAQSGETCNNGYKCCQTICSTCTSCSGTGTSRSCRTYQCNCRCTLFTGAHQCTVNCHQIFTAVIGFEVTDSGNTYNGLYEKGFDTDSTASDEFVQSFPIGKRIKCWYDPEPTTPRQVRIDSDVFTPWKFGIFGTFGCGILFVCLVFYTKLAYEHFGMSKRYLWPSVGATWIGVLIPVVIFVPVMVKGYEVNQTDMTICIVVFTICGNLPLAYLLFKDYGNLDVCRTSDDPVPEAEVVYYEEEEYADAEGVYVGEIETEDKKIVQT